MNQNTTSKVVAIVSVVIAGYFAVRLSEYAAVAGAQLGGLKEGGWNWQFLAPMAAGRLFGVIITLVVATGSMIYRKSRVLQIWVTLVTAPVLVFTGAAISYSIKLHPQKKERENTMRLISRADSDSGFRNALVGKARDGSITMNERWALMQAIYQQRTFLDEDISFLISFFADDVSAVDPLLRYEAVTIDDLRSAYERHKLDSGHSRISEVLVGCGRAPLDVLEDIVEHNSRYPGSHRYSHHFIEKARDELVRREKSRHSNPYQPPCLHALPWLPTQPCD